MMKPKDSLHIKTSIETEYNIARQRIRAEESVIFVAFLSECKYKSKRLESNTHNSSPLFKDGSLLHRVIMPTTAIQFVFFRKEYKANGTDEVS